MDFLTSRIQLTPTDYDRSRRFYEQTIGLAVYREWGEDDYRGVAFFLGGGGLLEVSGRGPAQPSPATKLVLQVRDAEATHRELAAKGVQIDAMPELKPWGLIEMTVSDPDGLQMIFVEIPADHRRRRG